VKHSLKDEAAVAFESSFLSELRRFFIMRGDHDHFCYSIAPDGILQEFQDACLLGVRLPGMTKDVGMYQKHAITLISLHNLSASTMPSLYKIVNCTTREFYMVGNVSELKKVNANLTKFINNVASAGLIRRNVVFECPKHECDVLLGEGKEGIQSGCRELCNVPLSCGHPCSQSCHFHEDQTFDETWFPCRERCKAVLPCGHLCPYSCSQPCIERCMEQLQTTLECGHTAMIECWEKKSTELFCLKQKCKKKNDISKMDTSRRGSHGFFSRINPF